MNEAKDYSVTLTIHATTTVSFAPMERDGPLTTSDAIENAIGSTFAFDQLAQDGFVVAYPIDAEVIEL